MDKILDLMISYPDFQLNQIIDPDQVDTNNSQIINKVNAIIKAVNTLTQGTTGASEITIATLPEFPTAKNVQTALQQIATYCKANNTSIAQITSRMTSVESKNTEQDNRLTSIETLNTTQNNRLTSVEAKNTLQDGAITGVDNRLKTIEGHNLPSRVTSVETKDTQQDTRLANLEAKDELDEAWVRSIDNRVTSNTSNIVRLDGELDEIRQINANAELIEARTSGTYGETYPTLRQRLDKNEIQIKTDISTAKRTKLNFLVTDADVNETWSDSVKLGDISVHESNDNAHGLVDKMNNAIAYHELDGTNHSDIRSEVSGLSSEINSLSNEVNTKIDKSQIANDLITTTTGMVLDASQGNTLSKQIEDVRYNGVSKLNNNVLVISGLNVFHTLNKPLTINEETGNTPPGIGLSMCINFGHAENVHSQFVYDGFGRVWVRKYTEWNTPQWTEWREFGLYYSKLPSSVTDLNTFFTFGKWTVEGNVQANTITNVPITGKSFSIENIPTVCDAGKLSSNYVLQRLTYYQDSQGTWERRYSNISGWGEWKKLATNQKAIPSLLNGWLVDGNLSVTRTGNTVFINGGVYGGSLVVDQPIMNIPIGFRRGEQFCVICTAQNSNGDATNIQVQILPNGDVVSNSPLKNYVKFNTFFEV